MDGKDCSKPCGRVFEFLDSSIGKKMTVGLAGLLLVGFLITHLAGNLFLFAGPNAFNHYAETLEANPLLPIAEAGLVFLFIVHILMSLSARWKNHVARPVKYEAYASKGGRTPGSRSMAVTGIVILVFIIIHVATFKFEVGGPKGENLYEHVTNWFTHPAYALFYVVAVLGVGLHLSHGVQSALQTFGVNHPRWTPLLKKAGLGLSALLTLGFASLPLYFLLRGGAR
jgi:succinate dehydrogenase / fumarate reductase cytochrome b subunit